MNLLARSADAVFLVLGGVWPEIPVLTLATCSGSIGRRTRRGMRWLWAIPAPLAGCHAFVGAGMPIRMPDSGINSANGGPRTDSVVGRMGIHQQQSRRCRGHTSHKAVCGQLRGHRGGKIV